MAEPTQGTGDNAPEFKAEDATAFLTEHGVDAKTLEGAQPDALKSQYELARTVAGKAAERAKAEATPKAPEKYDFTAGKDKDGKDVAPDAKLAESVTAYAKKHGLSQEAAQAAYNEAATIQSRALQALGEQVKKMHADWAQAAQADKEFGGEKFQENLAVAKEGMKAYGDQELIDLLSGTHEKGTGLENHPAVIRMFYKLGKLAKQDTTVRDGRVAGAPADARSFFPKSNMNA